MLALHRKGHNGHIFHTDSHSIHACLSHGCSMDIFQDTEDCQGEEDRPDAADVDRRSAGRQPDHLCGRRRYQPPGILCDAQGKRSVPA